MSAYANTSVPLSFRISVFSVKEKEYCSFFLTFIFFKEIVMDIGVCGKRKEAEEREREREKDRQTLFKNVLWSSNL